MDLSKVIWNFDSFSKYKIDLVDQRNRFGWNCCMIGNMPVYLSVTLIKTYDAFYRFWNFPWFLSRDIHSWTDSRNLLHIYGTDVVRVNFDIWNCWLLFLFSPFPFSNAYRHNCYWNMYLSCGKSRKVMENRNYGNILKLCFSPFSVSLDLYDLLMLKFYWFEVI